MNPQLRDAYRFFFEHAGYVVGRRAEGALALARAELKAERIGLGSEWHEDEMAEAFNGEEYQEYPAERCGATINGETLASLGGIIEPDRNYRRVVEAELAAEVFATYYSAAWGAK